MQLDSNIYTLFENRLINYWQLFFYNKYLYSFFNTFCREGNRSFTLKLIYLLLTNLKKKASIPPILILKSVILNFKQFVKVNVKKFKRRRYYSITYLSYEHQVKQSISNLVRYFYLVSRKSRVESLVEQLTYFFLSLFLKTKSFYGRYMHSMSDYNRRVQNLVDDAKEVLSKKRKRLARIKNKYVRKRLKAKRKLLDQKHQNRYEKSLLKNKDKETDGLGSKLLLTSKYLKKSKKSYSTSNIEDSSKELTTWKPKSKVQKKRKYKKRRKFSTYLRRVKFDRFKRFKKRFNTLRVTKKVKSNNEITLKYIDNIVDTSFYDTSSLDYFNDIKLTNIDLNNSYPNRATIRRKLIFFFIKIKLKKMYHVMESIYFHIFRSNMSMFSFLYKKDYLNENQKINELVEDLDEEKNKSNLELEFRFKHFTLWFIHVSFGLNDGLLDYTDKYIYKQLLSKSSLYKRFYAYYNTYYNINKFNKLPKISSDGNLLNLDIKLKKTLIKRFKEQLEFFDVHIEKNRQEQNIKEEKKKRLRKLRLRKILFNQVKFNLRIYLFDQINKNMNKFIFALFRRLQTLSKTINFKKKRKTFRYRFVPRATISYFN